MATYTENYSLLKPGEEDFYSIEDFNENMDTIDTLMAENETAVNGIDGKIGNPGDTGTGTLFGAVAAAGNNTGSVIKSIQRVTAYGNISLSKTIDINKVDTSKTFVIMERLRGAVDSHASVSYSLSSTSITVSASNSSNEISIGFWIIEFK